MEKRKSLERFITQNFDRAYRLGVTYMKNQQDAEDVLSESILKALQSADSIKDVDKIKPWFFQIISNTAISAIKQKQKICAVDEVYSEITYDEYNFDDLNDVIQKLPNQYLEIIVLRYFEDMKIKDIALILEENENTIKTRLYKALKIFKQDMEGVDYE